MKPKFVGAVTRGVLDLIDAGKLTVFDLVVAFHFASGKTEDWFYTIVVKGIKLYAADNGDWGYTVMLPEEY